MAQKDLSRKSSSPPKRPGSRKNGNSPTVEPARPRRSAVIIGLASVAVVAAAGATWHFVEQATQASAAKAAANSFEQASAAGARLQQEFDAYVACISGTTNPARTAADFQKRLAQANGGKYASLGSHVKADCTPAFRDALDKLHQQFSASDKLAPSWAPFEQAARALTDRADEYADKLAAHAAEDQVDASMVDAARRWSQDGAPEDAPRFESFLACAVPDAKIRTDKDALSRWAATQCAQETVGYSAFMQHLRADCAPRLQSGDPKPSSDEHAALSTVRTTKVLNNTMNIPLFMMMACTEHARRLWVGADGSAFVRAFGEASAKRQLLDKAVTGLQPKVTAPAQPASP